MTLRLTVDELAQHDGSDPSKALYVSVRGKVYDMTAGRSFYGPGGPYSVFAGKVRAAPPRRRAAHSRGRGRAAMGAVRERCVRRPALVGADGPGLYEDCRTACCCWDSCCGGWQVPTCAIAAGRQYQKQWRGWGLGAPCGSFVITRVAPLGPSTNT